ncbi:MAG: hypothetical protein ACOYUZ_04565 [Patescibacteria group bacterium]
MSKDQADLKKIRTALQPFFILFNEEGRTAIERLLDLAAQNSAGSDTDLQAKHEQSLARIAELEAELGKACGRTETLEAAYTELAQKHQALLKEHDELRVRSKTVEAVYTELEKKHETLRRCLRNNMISLHEHAQAINTTLIEVDLNNPTQAAPDPAPAGPEPKPDPESAAGSDADPPRVIDEIKTRLLTEDLARLEIMEARAISDVAYTACKQKYSKILGYDKLGRPEVRISGLITAASGERAAHFFARLLKACADEYEKQIMLMLLSGVYGRTSHEILSLARATKTWRDEHKFYRHRPAGFRGKAVSAAHVNGSAAESGPSLKPEGAELILDDKLCLFLYEACAQGGEAYAAARVESIQKLKEFGVTNPAEAIRGIMARATQGTGAFFIANMLRSCKSKQELEAMLDRLAALYLNSKDELLAHAKTSLYPEKSPGRRAKKDLPKLVLKYSKRSLRRQRRSDKSIQSKPNKAKASKTAKTAPGKKPASKQDKVDRFPDKVLNDRARFELAWAKHCGPDEFAKARVVWHKKLGIADHPGRGGIINTFVNSAVHPKFRFNFAARFLTHQKPAQRQQILLQLAELYGMNPEDLKKAVADIAPAIVYL